MSLSVMEKYLEDNLSLIKTMQGIGIKNMYRFGLTLSSRWKDINDIVVVLSDGRNINCSIDEGKSNIVLTLCPTQERYEKFRKKNLVKNFKGYGFLGKGNFNKILRIAILSKHHDFNEWHSMSGLIFEVPGFQFAIGNCLTNLCVQSLWLIKLKELNQEYKRQDV